MIWLGTSDFINIMPYNKYTDSRLYYIFLKELCYYLQTKVQKPVYFRRIGLQECLEYLDDMGEKFKEMNPYRNTQTPTKQVEHYTFFQRLAADGYAVDIYLLGHLFEYYFDGTGPSKKFLAGDRSNSTSWTTFYNNLQKAKILKSDHEVVLIDGDSDD